MSAPGIGIVGGDEDLVAAVRVAMGPAVPGAEAVVFDDVDDLTAHDGHLGVIVVGGDYASRQRIGELATLRDRYPATQIVLAFDRRPTASTRAIVRTGAVAMVDPAERGELGRALARGAGIHQDLVSTSLTPAEPPAAPSRNGQIMTVCSATGGCGKTFMATNLAYYLARWTGARVALVDLDLQFGEVAAVLRLRPQRTIVDALRVDAEGEDLATHLPQLLTPHTTGVSIMAAPKEPAEADRVSPPDVQRVLRVLQQEFDYVVVDTPTGLGETVLTALDMSEHLFVMATLDVSSVRNLRLFVDTLERLRIPTVNVSMLLNKTQAGLGVTIDQVERAFPGGFRALVPYGSEVPRSATSGMPVIATNPAADVSRALSDGLTEFLPEQARSVARAHHRDAVERGPLKRLFDRFRPTPHTAGGVTS